MRPKDSATGCKPAVPCQHAGMDDDLDRLCARIDGLKKLSPGHWIAPSQAQISYPPASHATMAEVEASSFWFGHRNQVIVSAVCRFPPKGPLLDVGGGNGFVSLGLREAGFSAIVVEPGPSGAQASRKRGLPVIEAAFEMLAIPDGSLSAVGMFDVLEHVEKDDATLLSLHAALQSGGKLYLAVPALAALWSGADRDGGHYRRYTQAGLSRQLGQAGFRVATALIFLSPWFCHCCC